MHSHPLRLLAAGLACSALMGADGCFGTKSPTPGPAGSADRFGAVEEWVFSFDANAFHRVNFETQGVVQYDQYRRSVHGTARLTRNGTRNWSGPIKFTGSYNDTAGLVAGQVTDTENWTSGSPTDKGSEASLSISEDGTYELQLQSFEFNTSYRRVVHTGLGPDEVTTKQDEVFTQLLPEPIPLPADGLVLAGSQDVRFHPGRSTRGDLDPKGMKMSWSLSPAGKSKWVLEPQAGYADALPAPGTEMRFEVHPDEGDEGAEVPLRVVLWDVSREPGTCLDSADQAEEPDLELVQDGLFKAPEKNGDEWRMQTSKEVGSATVRVRFKDQGAWGRLRAEVLVDGAWTPVRVVGAESGFATVPRDEDCNHVADAWEKSETVSGEASSDQETSNGNANLGDGLTLYEEYRGLCAGGAPVRLSGKQKDLVVANEAGGVVAAGLSAFEAATQIRIREVSRLPESRQVNVNSRFSKQGSQFGLRFVKVAVINPDDPEAIAQSLPPVPVSSPKECQQIQISESAPAAGVLKAVPHEIAHALSVQHHGDESEPKGVTIQSYASIGVYDEKGNALPLPYTIPADEEIGGEHGPGSGDPECFMAYTHVYTWVHRRQPAEYRKVDWSGVGAPSHFCASTQGAGLNQGGANFGDAASGRGNCLAAMRVKDY